MTTTPRDHWWLGLALLGVAGALGLVFLGPRQSLAVIGRGPADRNILRVAFVQPLSPDPHQRSFPLPAQNLLTLGLWEPLVECDPVTGEPQPAAAASWSWSTDRRVLTLQLRPDARWSNGDHVTAHDFVRGWHRLLRQKIDTAQTLFALKNAEAYHRGKLKAADAVGVKALDDLTLQVELDHVRSAFVAELADPLLAPLHGTSQKILEERGYGDLPALLVSNGAFSFAGSTGETINLVANAHFHGRAGVRLSGVRFVRVTNLSMARLLLSAGVIDLVAPAAFGETAEPPTARSIRVERELVFAVNSLDFNVTRGPLRDARVRQALALALDRQSAIDQYDPDRFVPAWSWVPTMPGREGLTLLQEDAAEARRLLVDAGYPGGQGLPVMVMTLSLRQRSDPYPRVWADRWYQELGIRTYLAFEPPAQRGARLTAGNYDIVPNTLIATVPDPGDLLSIFLWPEELSGTKWSDPEVVRLLNKSNALTGVERLTALEAAERRAMDFLPAIPTTFERRQAAMAAEVRGWYGDPLARQALKRLWLEPLPWNRPVNLETGS